MESEIVKCPTCNRRPSERVGEGAGQLATEPCPDPLHDLADRLASHPHGAATVTCPTCGLDADDNTCPDPCHRTGAQRESVEACATEITRSVYGNSAAVRDIQDELEEIISKHFPAAPGATPRLTAEDAAKAHQNSRDYVEMAANLNKALTAPVAATGLSADHPDDLAVDQFAAKMKAKLAEKRAQGYGGWDTNDCPNGRIPAMLAKHVEKGDPVDVANLAMMCFHRGESTAVARLNAAASGEGENTHIPATSTDQKEACQPDPPSPSASAQSETPALKTPCLDKILATFNDYKGHPHPDAIACFESRERIAQARAELDALKARLRAAAADARELVKLYDTRLKHAAKVADYAQHRPLCLKNGPPCTCKLAELIVTADDFNAATEARGIELIRALAAQPEPRRE